MAFKIESVFAYGLQAFRGVSDVFEQKLVLNISGTTADIVLDIGNTSSAFWTGLTNTAAEIALYKKIVQDIQASLITNTAELPEVEDAYAQIAATGTVATKQYKKTQPLKSLKYELFAGEGLTLYTVIISGVLKPEVLPTNF
jgi:hypothetical protein